MRTHFLKNHVQMKQHYILQLCNTFTVLAIDDIFNIQAQCSELLDIMETWCHIS